MSGIHAAPCGLFPPKAPVLGAAYGRQTVAIERIGLFADTDDIQKSFNHLLASGMRKVTFDTNCIIDMEEERPDSVFLKSIVSLWRSEKIKLSVVAVSASENQPGGRINETYGQFQEKLAAVNLNGVCELLPLAYWDVFYWDHALLADEEMIGKAKKIRDVLFPNTEEEAPTGKKELRAWRNKLCDVLVAWSHAHHNWDVLVTRDENFHKKKGNLEELGIKSIMYPKEALELCQPESSAPPDSSPRCASSLVSLALES